MNKSLISQIMSEAKFRNSTIDKDNFRKKLNYYFNKYSNIKDYTFVDYPEILDVNDLSLTSTFGLGVLDNCLYINL